jgi:hypothetical protein
MLESRDTHYSYHCLSTYVAGTEAAIVLPLVA